MSELALPRLRPDQWEIVAHPAKTKLVCMGRRWGKTTLAGAIALATAAAGGKVLWMAPTYRNARPLWRWAEAATGPLVRPGLVALNRSEHTIDFPSSGGFLGVYSADNDTAVRGEWFNLAILDEAARIPASTWTDVVQPSLADADGDALLPSTPLGKNWFWEEWERGISRMDADVAAWTAPSTANPMPSIQRAAELARERVPDSTYRQEWLAEFVATANDSFDREWWASAAGTRFDNADPRFTNAAAGRWLSADTAFSDSGAAAYTACVVGELTPDYRLLVREVWRERLTFPNLLERLEATARRWNADSKLRGLLIEDKASGISATQTFRETAEPWLARLVVPFAPHGSKEQRAGLAAVYCKRGDVWLPEPNAAAPWLATFEGELWAFPAGQYKDQVDAFSQLVLYLSGYLQAGAETRARAAARLLAA